ncbi:MAG: alanine--tRNA ligase, partial [Verrucomicrobia bacterium]|nr:alanine--tRNA ligase [Verrucomicrobiota bacterium]
MTSSEIRQSFLDFFKSKEHEIVPSAPLLPTAPNLLFTNAGMNPFVPYFLGERNAVNKRVADTQKCIRAGGKHNDLEDVGFDTYHLTFFEMLGNWSFGDYFKLEAIEWAWELLTEVWKFPKERLYATVYEPGKDEPAKLDQETYDLWKTIFETAGLDPKVHIVMGGKKDNFWMMGDTGPCGPCSEIHMDLTPNGDSKGKLVNKDSPLCIEIWNLVFIQFNATPLGTFVPLAHKHVDTGMGFERVCGIMGTTKNFTDFGTISSNYNCDLFQDIFVNLTKLSNKAYQATLPKSPDKMSEQEATDVAFRVIADHVRTLSCSIADGILPGNEGRNYVLRRILRRAIMFGNQLGLRSGFFEKLVTPVVEKLGSIYPELVDQKKVIEKVIRSEEEAFGKTLDRGLALFDRVTRDGSKIISGKAAFTLYDTYGFPLDLTQLIARERGLTVETDEFDKAMMEQ